MVSEIPQKDGGSKFRGDADTPFRNDSVLLLTAEQAAGVRAFLRELSPGIYVKCSECHTMRYGDVTVYTRDFNDGRGFQTVCEPCWKKGDAC